MSRKLTPEERNKVKNLQVSNSIYKKDITKLVEQMKSANNELEDLKVLANTQLGEELQKTEQRITQLESEIGSIVGKIKHKEGRIAAKEAEIEAIKTVAAREEETVIESVDMNSPEKIAEREAKLAAKEAAKAAKKNKRTKKENPEVPPTEEF